MTRIDWPNLNRPMYRNYFAMGMSDARMLSARKLDLAARKYAARVQRKRARWAAYWAGVMHGKELLAAGCYPEDPIFTTLF